MDIETIVKAVTFVQIEVEQSLYIKVETWSRFRHISPCPPLLKVILSYWHSNSDELSSTKVGNVCVFVLFVRCSKLPRGGRKRQCQENRGEYQYGCCRR